MLKLYCPVPGSETLHLSSDDMGDVTVTLIGHAAVISPASTVLTADQCAKLALGCRASTARRAGKALPPNVELVNAAPPEWSGEVEGEGRLA